MSGQKGVLHFLVFNGRVQLRNSKSTQYICNDYEFNFRFIVCTKYKIFSVKLLRSLEISLDECKEYLDFHIKVYHVQLTTSI